MLPCTFQVWYDFDTYTSYVGPNFVNVSVDINKVCVLAFVELVI